MATINERGGYVRGSYSPKRRGAKVRHFRVSLLDEEIDEFERQASCRGIIRTALMQRVIIEMLKHDMFNAVLNDRQRVDRREK